MSIINDNILFYINNFSIEELFLLNGLASPQVKILPSKVFSDEGIFLIPKKEALFSSNYISNIEFEVINDNKLSSSDVMIRLNKSFFNDMEKSEINVSYVSLNKFDFFKFIEILVINNIANSIKEMEELVDKYVEKVFVNDSTIPFKGFSHILMLIETLKSSHIKNDNLSKYSFIAFNEETRKRLFSLREIYEQGVMFKDYDSDIINYKKRKQIYNKVFEEFKNNYSLSNKETFKRIKIISNDEIERDFFIKSLSKEVQEKMKRMFFTLNNKKVNYFLGAYNNKLEIDDINLIIVEKNKLHKNKLKLLKNIGVDIVESENLKEDIIKYSVEFNRNHVLKKKKSRP